MELVNLPPELSNLGQMNAVKSVKYGVFIPTFIYRKQPICLWEKLCHLLIELR